MKFKYFFNQSFTLMTLVMLVVAAIVTLLFPDAWYLQEKEWQLSAERTIPGIKGGLSGLTWNPDSGTLFAVTDHPSTVVELDREGNVLRVIPSAEDHDFEGIEYLGRNLYILSRERERILSTHRIDNGGLLSSPLYRFTLNINRNSDNAGFEGLTRGEMDNALIVAQEKKPLRLYTTDHTADAMTVSDALTRRVALPWYLKDISGLHYDRTRRQLYVLSHESAMVLVSDLSGGKKVILLRRGFHGLKRDIPQPEGIASDDGDTLWIVSEPNLFYRFSRGRTS
ncbi:YjiK family protein [Escherichia coli]|nr:YjiK family protein [Escherichia coli]EFI9569063.1 YjiK family protein [Escherichia coli]EFU2738007.1 YjiK family protein [Escherichia coli]EGB0884978.1 YjiK family protein [Escherichia coli]EGF1717599.1 YjiK family protein [Escherichia coli]